MSPALLLAAALVCRDPSGALALHGRVLSGTSAVSAGDEVVVFGLPPAEGTFLVLDARTGEERFRAREARPARWWRRGTTLFYTPEVEGAEDRARVVVWSPRQRGLMTVTPPRGWVEGAVVLEPVTAATAPPCGD